MVMFLFKVIGLGFMNDSACIYMCCNIERNIMKKNLVVPRKINMVVPVLGFTENLSVFVFCFSPLYIFFFF